MWASILTGLLQLFGLFEKLLTKHYSKQNVLRETAKREAEIQDEAETAARLAADPITKDEGIRKMRDLISE
jgi:hypothetical protein